MLLLEELSLDDCVLLFDLFGLVQVTFDGMDLVLQVCDRVHLVLQEGLEVVEVVLDVTTDLVSLIS